MYLGAFLGRNNVCLRAFPDRIGVWWVDSEGKTSGFGGFMLRGRMEMRKISSEKLGSDGMRGLMTKSASVPAPDDPSNGETEQKPVKSIGQSDGLSEALFPLVLQGTIRVKAFHMAGLEHVNTALQENYQAPGPGLIPQPHPDANPLLVLSSKSLTGNS